jgi:5'-nucleotidase
MSKEKFILVTNDDGITAKGIEALVEAAKQFGRVMVVAPDKPQSGMGHAITVNNPLRFSKVNYFKDIEAYSTSGTPVDCVKLGIYKLSGQRPDLIVSGVNHGSNCSTNVLYSGTMSAAVEGALEGIPSIGFSLLDYSMEADFSASILIARKVIGEALEQGNMKGYCLNVNIPKLPFNEIKGYKVCRQAAASWDDYFEERQDPIGKNYYWLAGEFKSFDGGTDTDMWALENGYVSIVPTQFDMTAHHAISQINTWKL